MINSVLVANRGEIALRVIWACRELGIRPVAVYSEADRDSLHVKFADEDICIGPGPAADSYLNIASVIAAADVLKVDAIHPGYGFLSENAHFAEVCESCGFKFIGPRPDHIRRMGDKVEAKRLMAAAGLPMLPGSDGPIDDVDAVHEIADKIGYPVLLKAAAGGGGRGMRIVVRSEDLGAAFQTAAREAEASFGNGDMYMEKYLARPRHVEVQLLGDTTGNLVHLGERECSVQRKYQKIVEETPSPALTPEQRESILADALRGAASIDYVSAGTMEFLVDGDGDHYFMEMNTRIQVEHPITEAVTLVDLVKEQIRVAAGLPIQCTQDEIEFRGHSIECRINAEDPETLVPCPGQITAFNVPKGPGVRVDTAAHEDYYVSPFYDSMIAKVIVHGRDRAEAMARMRRCLELMIVEGIKTNIPLLRRVVVHPAFVTGDYDTHLINEILPGAGPQV